MRLHDPTGMAARVVGPYLVLFDDLDVMWGDRNAAPEEVVFITEENAVCWRRETLGGYTEAPSPTTGRSGVDGVEIRLEPAAGPAAVLPGTAGPMVVVRSSWLPMPMHDHIDALPQRRVRGRRSRRGVSGSGRVDAGTVRCGRPPRGPERRDHRDADGS